MPLSEAEKRERKIARTVKRYKCLRIGKCIADTARKFQEMTRVEGADENRMITCVSCGERFQLGKGVDAGHWLSRSKASTIFDEMNCHPQCALKCNRYDDRGEAKVRYNTFMIETYGQEAVDALILKSNQPKSFTREELAELRYGFMERIAVAKKKFIV